MKKVTQILKNNSQLIIEDWERQVFELVKSSTSANRIALRDHVPNILNDIIGIMEEYDIINWNLEDPKIALIESNSIDHGRHRASSGSFSADEILHEYIIFHNVILRVLNINGVKDHNTYNILKCCVDKSMMKSLEAYTKSIEEMQSKLVATLAHDIRNPLSAARLGIEMLNTEDIDQDRSIRVKKMTMHSVNKALEMLEGLLDSITVKAGEGMMLTYAEIDLYSDIETIYQEASDIYSEEIILECPDKDLYGIYDAVAVRRMLENLITNAIKYGDTNTPITMKIEKDGDDQLLLSVHNYGNPIPQEKQKAIFDFLQYGKQTKKPKFKSWGIGLTLVKMVAEAHGGAVELTSEKDKGTEFKIRISSNSNKPGKTRTKLNLV
ncbi:sensor histidine kinase [uncultured Christiangramia sp.]|uniref:sensor histidine kinase n=1 Tax=Christiangramia sp. 3-2217-3z TaxID=3417564 RepID=UPI00261751EB|nr:sensor histidine kinase [uncultured Christiangramia sp.]